jgi:hypothetical protein
MQWGWDAEGLCGACSSREHQEKLKRISGCMPATFIKPEPSPEKCWHCKTPIQDKKSREGVLGRVYCQVCAPFYLNLESEAPSKCCETDTCECAGIWRKEIEELKETIRIHEMTIQVMNNAKKDYHFRGTTKKEELQSLKECIDHLSEMEKGEGARCVAQILKKLLDHLIK